jgi:hypothetical protein
MAGAVEGLGGALILTVSFLGCGFSPQDRRPPARAQSWCDSEVAVVADCPTAVSSVVSHPFP